MSQDDGSPSLLIELLRRTLERAPTYGFARLDPSRFRGSDRPLSLRERISRNIRAHVWSRWFEPHFQARTRQALATLEGHRDALEQLDPLYRSLGNDDSRARLLDVLSHRLLGADRSRLDSDTPEYWRQRERVVECADPASGELPRGARVFDLDPLGLDVRLQARVHGVHATFVAEQYRYESADIGARPGDVVLDCGACWGDTSLQFADCVGDTGRVHAFEFVPDNLAVLRENLERNAELAERITVHAQPVWSASEVELGFDGIADNSRLKTGPGGGPTVRTIAIDDYVASAEIDRVHLIKMDVEGAESEALRGAERTIRRDRPQLAISLYHRPDDLWQLPRLIQSLDLGYELFVDHGTTYYEETMLFARTRD